MALQDKIEVSEFVRTEVYSVQGKVSLFLPGTIKTGKSRELRCKIEQNCIRAQSGSDQSHNHDFKTIYKIMNGLFVFCKIDQIFYTFFLDIKHAVHPCDQALRKPPIELGS